MANDKLTPTDAKNLMTNILSIEKGKVEVDKLREKNISKQIDSSEKTAIYAKEVALKDLEITEKRVEKDFDLKKRIIDRIFWVILALIILIVALMVFFSFRDKTIVKDILSGFFEIVKYIVVGLLGYFIKAAREKVRKSKKG